MNETLLINISKTEFEKIIKDYFTEKTKEILKQMQENRYLHDTDETKGFIKEKELAKSLGLNQITLYHWRKQGKIKFKKIGKLIYYDKNEVINLMK